MMMMSRERKANLRLTLNRSMSEPTGVVTSSPVTSPWPGGCADDVTTSSSQQDRHSKRAYLQVQQQRAVTSPTLVTSPVMTSPTPLLNVTTNDDQRLQPQQQQQNGRTDCDVRMGGGGGGVGGVVIHASPAKRCCPGLTLSLPSSPCENACRSVTTLWTPEQLARRLNAVAAAAQDGDAQTAPPLAVVDVRYRQNNSFLHSLCVYLRYTP